MTREALVVGFDLGSSAAKVVVATISGTVLARRSGPQRIERPGPGRAVQDPEDWWASLCQLTTEALGSIADAQRSEIAAVAISGHFPTLIVTDELDQPLTAAMLYADARADRYVEAASELAGHRLLGDELLPKLLWLRAELPWAFKRVRRIFNPQDYLVYRLTGSHVLDHHTASRLGGLLDVRRLEWRESVTASLGLPADALPDLRRPGDLAGTVTAAAAAETGFAAGTPVVTGFGDTLAALVGTGVVHRAEVLLYYGTTATADVCTCDIETYLSDPTLLAVGAPYAEVAYALLGPALHWAARGFGGGAVVPSLSELDEAAQALGAQADAPFVLPFFMERPPSGAPMRRPSIVGLDIGQGRTELHRALLESFGYVIRSGLEGLGFDSVEMSRFVAGGGGAASEAWRQIVSDVLGVDQHWDADSDGALGDAMLASWASGGVDMFGRGLSGWRGPGGVTVPNQEAVDLHRVRFSIWKRLVSGMADAYEPERNAQTRIEELNGSRPASVRSRASGSA
jgi:xylulokinase